MTFYNEISKYYDDLFPSGDAQIELLKETIGEAPKKILDVACGNGVYSAALAKEGYEVTGIDSSKDMINEAILKAEVEGVHVEALNCNMREMTKQLAKSRYDGIFCIGNSLVHLNKIEEVQNAVNQFYELLKEEGRLLIQIMNYDRIIDNKITALPPIQKKEKDLEFLRYYTLDEEKDRIFFRTVLKVAGENMEHTIELLPIRSEALIKAIEKSGFKIEALYGAFNKEAYENKKSYHTIVVARKQ